MNTMAVGNGFILPTTEDFVQGYQAGYLAYLMLQRSSLLTDKQLITLIIARLEDVDRSELYCVGYVVGWITALAQRGSQRKEEVQG